VKRPLPHHVFEDRFYRKPDVAAALGISISTLDRLIRRGELHTLRVGNSVRLLGRDINDYLVRRSSPVA
jgi:excisionase family DNA binding protein